MTKLEEIIAEIIEKHFAIYDEQACEDMRNELYEAIKAYYDKYDNDGNELHSF